MLVGISGHWGSPRIGRRLVVQRLFLMASLAARMSGVRVDRGLAISRNGCCKTTTQVSDTTGGIVGGEEKDVNKQQCERFAISSSLDCQGL